MLKNAPAFSGFSVNDISAAQQFYSEVLGLEVEQAEMGLTLKLAGGNTIFVYAKADHMPATFTVLNFEVEDIDQAVNELKARGISFEHYAELNGNDDVLRGRSANQGPDIAWFKDPAGNILSILH